jgi:hypothetical protein
MLLESLDAEEFRADRLFASPQGTSGPDPGGTDQLVEFRAQYIADGRTRMRIAAVVRKLTVRRNPALKGLQALSPLA